VIKESPSAKRN
jgi:hypothetical protein